MQGLVTLEDILEEIVGDFTTNTADNDDEVIAREDGSYLIDGAATMREINKATGWDLPTNGPKTLNGIVFEQLESIPDGNVSFIVAGYRFETEEISGTMVKKVCVSCMKKPEQPDE
jgi:Mg2+/Co2+ transporter CorB